ncbi:hypothetical protein [Bradyrhizobium sp. USDA 377]
MVIDTSLTMVLAEPPLPPDSELPPADCDDDVADVDDVAELVEAPDVEDAAEDDAVAVDGVAVTAALDDAMALIDMKTSPERDLGRSFGCVADPHVQRSGRTKQALACEKFRPGRTFPDPTAATKRGSVRCSFFPFGPSVPSAISARAVMDGQSSRLTSV